MASGELSKIVFAQNNPSFTTVLNDLARNERYRTTKTPKPVLVVTPLKELQVQGTLRNILTSWFCMRRLIKRR
ncbi:hypothetical protein VIGAN_05110000 [Vigna angularis var. angularis]|uniref:Uncharacterized protein n=1 Tax=Vigna angularis var. angularis TaxID=157739 RepID=A0A0S3S4F0_PHAAN|nr:hypothetical protein VIGAN_05110000 [Vigna angularis var. angularis]